MSLVPLALAIVVLASLATTVIAWVIRQERHRREGLQAWATAQGWTYTRSDRALPASFDRFEPFGLGRGHPAQNILRGPLAGAPAVLFDYSYTVRTGKTSQTHQVVVAALTMPMDGRGLTVRRETVGHKIIDALGGEDIDVEDDAFSRRFWVRCADRRFAYDVLHPPMMAHLDAHGLPWTWQWQGTTLLVYRHGTLDADAADDATQALAGFAAALPRHRLHEVRHVR